MGLDEDYDTNTTKNRENINSNRVEDTKSTRSTNTRTKESHCVIDYRDFETANKFSIGMNTHRLFSRFVDSIKSINRAALYEHPHRAQSFDRNQRSSIMAKAITVHRATKRFIFQWLHLFDVLVATPLTTLIHTPSAIRLWTGRFTRPPQEMNLPQHDTRGNYTIVRQTGVLSTLISCIRKHLCQ